MKLGVGQILHSTVDATAVIVIKAPVTELTLTCGGAPMTDVKPAAPPAAGADAGGGTQLGKRYVADAQGLELLCTKAGAGVLEVDGTPLPLKAAKPLPASD